MASIGPLSPGTVVDSADVGTVAWIYPDRAEVSDNKWAQVELLSNISHYLKATNFGFTIPAGATIDGILVEIEERGFGSIKEYAIKIVKSDGSIGTTNKSTGATLPTSDAYVEYGSSSDLWGESWSASDINNSNFGVVLALEEDSGLNDFCIIDHIRITVYYTEITPKPLPTFFRP